MYSPSCPSTQLSKRKWDLVPAAASLSTALQTSLGCPLGHLEHQGGRAEMAGATESHLCSSITASCSWSPGLLLGLCLDPGQPAFRNMLVPLSFNWIIKEGGRPCYLYWVQRTAQGWWEGVLCTSLVCFFFLNFWDESPLYILDMSYLSDMCFTDVFSQLIASLLKFSFKEKFIILVKSDQFFPLWIDFFSVLLVSCLPLLNPRTQRSVFLLKVL